MDKRELKDKIIEEQADLKYIYEDYVSYEQVLVAEDVLNLIDQLDEPETLSLEWLREHLTDGHNVDLGDAVVFVDDLQNLLMPKQDEPEKVVVPEFVAEWIEKYKPMDSLRVAFIYIHELPREDTFKIWIENGMSETFARAWLDGYEVEKEQKYILSINITDKASKTNYETFLNKRGIFHSMENESFNSEEFNWSEEEIKDLESGEILFEHFATKVGELEE